MKEEKNFWESQLTVSLTKNEEMKYQVEEFYEQVGSPHRSDVDGGP